MKKQIVMALIVVAAMVSVLPVPAAAEEPSQSDIQRIVKDVAEMDEIIKDLTPSETAAVVVRVIKSIEDSKMTKAEKKRAIALVVARAVAYKPEQAPDMMAALVVSMKSSLLLPIVVSAAIIAAEGNSTAVCDAMLAQFRDDRALLKIISESANTPVDLLTPPVIKEIQDMIREMRRAAVPIIPAQEPTTVPLVPPLVPGRYPGQ